MYYREWQNINVGVLMMRAAKRERLASSGERLFDAGFNLPVKLFALCIDHEVNHWILHRYSNAADGPDLASTPSH